MDHVSTFLCCSYRILRNVSFYSSEFQVITCIKHSTVSISTSLCQIILCLLCSCDKHLRSVKMFCKQCLRNLRSEVSKINNQCVTSCFLYIFQGLHHVDLTLYDTDRTFIDSSFTIFFCVGIDQCFSSVHGKTLRETISAHCYNTDFQFWHVTHNKILAFFILVIISIFFMLCYPHFSCNFIWFSTDHTATL